MLCEFFDIYPNDIEKAKEISDVLLQNAGFSNSELSQVYQSAYIEYRAGLMGRAEMHHIDHSITAYIIDCIFRSTLYAIEVKYEHEYENELFDYEWTVNGENSAITIIYKGQKYDSKDTKSIFDEMNTISKDKIRKGIEKRIVNFIVDPNLGAGTVCQIGGDWFYFGGDEAENTTPEEYVKNTPIDTLADKIFNVLEDFKEQEETKDEYIYILLKFRENDVI